MGIEIEPSARPPDLAAALRSGYAGQRLLYADPEGARAWTHLVRFGFGRDRWIAGAVEAAERWTDPKGGPIAHAAATPLDFLSLGSGDGEKDARILPALAASRGLALAYVPIDVSIPLLVQAHDAGRAVLAEQGIGSVKAIAADFESGALDFLERLPTGQARGTRLVAMLGNVFGNLRDEPAFVRGRLSRFLRAGDLLWLEVGLRPKTPADDPLHADIASEDARRLLDGPYRRASRRSGRPLRPHAIEVHVREADASASVPGSINFACELVFEDSGERWTILYSRRYTEAGLVEALDRLGFSKKGAICVHDAAEVPRVLHLLLERRSIW